MRGSQPSRQETSASAVVTASSPWPCHRRRCPWPSWSPCSPWPRALVVVVPLPCPWSPWPWSCPGRLVLLGVTWAPSGLSCLSAPFVRRVVPLCAVPVLVLDLGGLRGRRQERTRSQAAEVEAAAEAEVAVAEAVEAGGGGGGAEAGSGGAGGGGVSGWARGAVRRASAATTDTRATGARRARRRRRPAPSDEHARRRDTRRGAIGASRRAWPAAEAAAQRGRRCAVRRPRQAEATPASCRAPASRAQAA